MKSVTRYLLLLVFFLATLPGLSASEEDKTVPSVYYYQFQPGFVTNFQKTKRGKLGYIRADIQVQVGSKDDVDTVHIHHGLLRDAILERLFSLNKNQVSSLEYRESLRDELKETLGTLMKEEVGRPVINEILFTQFIYQ
ncbi:MAG: flagellar basal body-associated protein FliL [Kangiellaceae bacterium]|nr:flagellar basal body-associated protein FliL [Kangiellaceae bacterium]|tara:strand:+ start:12800 stop:13216 length:417 start_codon:yes stop_codon:yes gene_type:complete